jgi:hypothetical protein
MNLATLGKTGGDQNLKLFRTHRNEHVNYFIAVCEKLYHSAG